MQNSFDLPKILPFFVNFFAKNYLVRPLTEYFWNSKQTEIFLNTYQQKRAFSELKDFEEKLRNDLFKILHDAFEYFNLHSSCQERFPNFGDFNALLYE